MNKTTKKALIALIIVILVAAVLLVIWKVTRPETQEGSKTLTIEVNHLDGTKKTLTVKTDAEYLSDALVKEGIIKGEDNTYGLMVTEVDGEFADAEKGIYWTYTKGGEYADTGVDGCVIADGDHYEFTIAQY